MKRVWLSILFVFVAACGRQTADFSEPADGQVFNLSQPGIQPRAVLADNKFDGISIEWRIPQTLAQTLSCQNTQNQPYSYCTVLQNGGNGANCSKQSPCEVNVIARDSNGQILALRTARFQFGQ